MRKEELQELITELQDICNLLSSEKDHVKNLIRLTSCVGKLKSYPEYSTVADEMLDAIETYDPKDPYSVEFIIAYAKLLISALNDKLNKGSALDSLKIGYGKLKDTIHTTVSSDEVKEVVDQLKNSSKEKAEQAMNMYREAEKVVKGKLKSWMFPDDE